MESVEDAIKRALAEIESQNSVRIVFACESGSRAWGFASEDSDYDARFVYVSSTKRYLSILPFREVIEEQLPGDLDMSGWDLRKALGLARKSNPPLLEWLRSPIFYHQDSVLFPTFQATVEACYSPDRCFLHYLHMAERNFREYLCGPDVWLKKYLYVLRPVLACRWIERWPTEPVPMEFRAVMERSLTDQGLKQAIESLLVKKSEGKELSLGPRIEEISSFIESELHRLKALADDDIDLPDAAPLDAYFRSIVLG